jgi:hypothetical protein
MGLGEKMAARMGVTSDSPTMIIPEGTDIQVDVHGQLSIRTPGNLVIQNSGHYANLESLNGSIRIESDADVEAVSVRCAETCFVEGSLTAWRVTARAIHLEDEAKANIVLQETDRLEVGSDARLVGNFASEKELFYLFSRFANELRSLPVFADRKKEVATELASTEAAEMLLPEGEKEVEGKETAAAGGAAEPSQPAPPRPAGAELADPLFYSLVILEREFSRPTYGPTSRKAIEELVSLLRSSDLDALGERYQRLFGKIVEPGKDLQRVFRALQGYYGSA